MKKTLTHEEYLAWQSLYMTTAYEKEEVDTICTALINLGMSAETARVQAMRCFHDVAAERIAKFQRETS